MHTWGHWPDKKFRMVEDAAEFIGVGMRRWGRIGVLQYKEKYGTVRVYCHFGLNSFYSIWRPHYCWIPKWWPYRLDLAISKYTLWPLNRLLMPIQTKIYRWFYKRAIQKWPSIKREIVDAADFPELLEGVVKRDKKG